MKALTRVLPFTLAVALLSGAAAALVPRPASCADRPAGSAAGTASVPDRFLRSWALAQADVGIAIGAGSDVAVKTADVIPVRSNPLDLVAIVEPSRATYVKMIQNLVWATGYNVIAIPLAAGALYAWGVVLTPAVGAALMSASTVIVAINARLLRLKQ